MYVSLVYTYILVSLIFTLIMSALDMEAVKLKLLLFNVNTCTRKLADSGTDGLYLCTCQHARSQHQ